MLNFFITLFSLNIIFSVVAYDKNAAVSWAESCAYGCSECPDDNSCGCTYFTTHALTHGGWGGGYEGVCNNLWTNFKNGKYAGWVKVSGNTVGPGDAVIMNNGHDGDASHCCVGTGSNLVSCHNPGKKDVAPSSTWYSGGYINAVYTYKGTAAEKEVAEPETYQNQTQTERQMLTDTIISCGAYENDACNCVYYARDRQPKLPSGLSTCNDKINASNSKTAAVGCVLFRTGDPTYCHAAYVTKVTSSTVYYDQSNWTPCKCSSDSLSISSSAILGYWCP
jgi:hypothetical protein